MKFEILAYEPTELGILCLRRRELLCEPGTMVTEVTLNHEFLMSSYLTASEKALAKTAVEMHSGSDLRVLVGGLGLGYTAWEAGQHERVADVVVIEMLQSVIDWIAADLTPLAEDLRSSSTISIIKDDVYRRLTTPLNLDTPCVTRSAYDIVAIDVDHSPEDLLGDSSPLFYTVEGLRHVATHLADKGVLGVWAYAEHTPFADAMEEVFGNVRVEKVTVWNDLIKEDQTDWLFFSRKNDPNG